MSTSTNETVPLRPYCIRHRYSIMLSDGMTQSFAVAATRSEGKLNMTVHFPPGVEDEPEAVPSELLDHVGTALERMRGEIALEELEPIDDPAQWYRAPNPVEQATAYGH